MSSRDFQHLHVTKALTGNGLRGAAAVRDGDSDQPAAPPPTPGVNQSDTPFGHDANAAHPGPPITPRKTKTERDVIALGILVAAIILFVGTGSSVLTGVLRQFWFGETRVDTLVANALILNVALIIFGWRRYTDLTRELAARKEAEAAALRLADTDPMTGLLNRRSFDVAMADAVQQTLARGAGLVLILIDLDGFKRANDNHGHHVGDIVLVEITRRTRDILPAHATLARLGGDEFAAFVPFAAGADVFGETERIVAQISAAIAMPVEHGEHLIVVTASIGVACPLALGKHAIDSVAETLMHHADIAMYQAKNAGRGRHCWFDPSMEADMLARSRLEQAIRAGLKNGEFRPVYEKQVDVATGAIIGLEMLARWYSPERGIVGPDVFVPVAEEIGVMPELSETLIRQALQDARQWAPHLTLAINISPVQLRDPWFAQRLLKMLLEAQMPPNRVDLEITEHCLNEDMALVRSLVTSLRNQGMRISLDDFGHSESSLAHLRTLPFDRIKIDRNFIARLGNGADHADNADSAAIVEAISALGRGMNLPITAEGIESTGVLNELRKLGTFMGQGYVYGQPMTAADLLTDLAQHALLAAKPVATAMPQPDRHIA